MAGRHTSGNRTRARVRFAGFAALALGTAAALLFSVTLQANAAQSVSNMTDRAWAGYAADSGSIKNPGFVVHDDFTVPRVDCRATPNGFVSIWAGLGGTGSGGAHLAQAGAILNCKNGKYDGRLFYQTPNDADSSFHFSPDQVNAGDHVSVSVCGNNGYYRNGPVTEPDGTPCIFASGQGPVSSVYMWASVVRSDHFIQWAAAAPASNTLTTAECIVERDQQKYPDQWPLIKFEPVTQQCMPARVSPTQGLTGTANFQRPTGADKVTRFTSDRDITARKPCKPTKQYPDGWCPVHVGFTVPLTSVGPATYSAPPGSSMPVDTFQVRWLQML